MTAIIPKGQLTAYQRWEVAAFDEEEQRAAREAEAAAQAEAAAANAESLTAPPIPEAVEVFEGEIDIPEEPAVVLPTAADIERIHNEAHEQGYSAGLAEGLADGKEKLKRINAILSNLDQALVALDQQVADQLLATAVEIANQMVRQSLRIKPEVLLPVVREAVNTLHPSSGHPALFAHPGDAALIRTHLGEQLAHHNWRIIEDDTLTPGGCRVELGASEIDATFETRWRRIIESIGINQDWLDNQP
ncbi:flagellar assembly protein FliH [Propionivibrio limicola]|uniref:flagellar assembly protein FliH n=1 Tax=Propionivibrio limicola TaxID=167645 RepID=UPI001292A522|nr:flagellar assembly protein FliH [Propionivibrio limicola]